MRLHRVMIRARIQMMHLCPNSLVLAGLVALHPLRRPALELEYPPSPLSTYLVSLNLPLSLLYLQTRLPLFPRKNSFRLHHLPNLTSVIVWLASLRVRHHDLLIACRSYRLHSRTRSLPGTAFHCPHVVKRSLLRSFLSPRSHRPLLSRSRMAARCRHRTPWQA